MNAVRSDDGLPPGLRAALEARSGFDMSDVRIHRHSGEAQRLKAHAFTRGSDIHLASGGEGYLAHEAWHVAQQKRGEVHANTRFGGQALSTSPRLEAEADRVGADLARSSPVVSAAGHLARASAYSGSVAQLAPNQEGTADPDYLLDYVRGLEGEGLTREEILARIRDDHASNTHRYIYTDRYGWVDLRHFGAAASYGGEWGSVAAETLGFANEVLQWLTEWGDDYRSGFSPEDIPSNAAGAEFGDDYLSDEEPLSSSLERWFDEAGARAQDDPLAHRSSLPETDPAVRGGTDRGSSNVSRTQSTASDNAPVNEFVNEWNAGWRALTTPEGWYRLFGIY